jgi:hypothetical protein
MAVLDSLNKSKRLGIGVGIGVLILGLGLIGFQFLHAGSNGTETFESAFYTDDNGKTFFKDKRYKIVPFDHNGKQAYRADVFQCPDGKQFVGLIYRHNALGKKAMEEHIAKRHDLSQVTGSGLELHGMEVKPAGAPDTAWKRNTGESRVKCPTGGDAQLVSP